MGGARRIENLLALTLFCALSVLGCREASPAQEGATSQGDLSGVTSQPAGDQEAPKEVPASPAVAVVIDDYRGHEGALALGSELRVAAEADQVVSWLTPRSTFPFDVDGKVSIEAPAALEGAIAQHMQQLTAQLKLNPECAVISGEDLLDGKPWPYLDKLGDRPPRKELERDLAKLGLKDGDWLVNCFHERALGILIIVDTSKDVGRIKGIRT